VVKGEQVHSGRLLGCLGEGNDAVEIVDLISIDKNIDAAGWQFNAPATNADSIDVRKLDVLKTTINFTLMK
jgi:hypothetical protein